MAITGRTFPSHQVYLRNAQAPAAQGQAQALTGTIACNLSFDYASGATPNDSSPLTVAHTLQGIVADLLIFNPQFTPQDTVPLTVTITLIGNITCKLIYTYTSGGQLLDSSNLNVAHTAVSNIVTQVNITGGSVDQITTQSSVACLAILSAQLAVAHTLQGNITDLLIFTYTSGGQLLDSSPLNVAHTLLSLIALSSSFTGSNNLNEASQTGIADVNVFSGFLNVNHTLTGSVITILGFSDSFAVAHTLDNGGVNGQSGLTDSFFTVAHTLRGNIVGSLGMTGDLPSSNLILISGGVLGSLGVAHTLQGSIDDVLVMSGGSNIAITGSGSIITIGTIIENVNVAHTLQGPITNALVISGDLNVAHTLQGTIDCYCVLQQTGIFDNCIIVGSLNVAHTLQGRIDTSTGLSANVNAGSTVTIADSGTITGDLGVAHTLQGSDDDSLNINDQLNNGVTGQGQITGTSTIIESLTVAHTLAGSITDSAGFTGDFAAGVLIAGVGIIVGSLGVDHTLQSTVNCTNQCLGSENTAHTLDNTGVVLVSTIATSDLGVSHTLISNITIISSGTNFLVTGNNGNIALISIVIGSLTNAVALQGAIVDSAILTVPTAYVTQQGFVLIPAGCAVVGSLNVSHSLIGLVSGVLTLIELVRAGAPTVTFPGDFIQINNKFTLLTVPARKLLFGNFKRIIRLFVPRSPGKQRG